MHMYSTVLDIHSLIMHSNELRMCHMQHVHQYSLWSHGTKATHYNIVIVALPHLRLGVHVVCWFCIRGTFSPEFLLLLLAPSVCMQWSQ